MNAGDEEARQLRERFDAMSPAMDLPLTATDPFFHEMHRIKKGSGELLLLSVDPRTCQGCGLCAAACPEEAIVIESRSPERIAELERARGVWERLPDTPGATIARAASNDAVGALAAVMMSRHSLFSLVGPDGAEPGSGERMALRQVLAVVEYEMQRRAVSRIELLDELNRRLRGAIRDGVVQSVPTGDLNRLDEALTPSGSAQPNLTAVLARLEELGERTDVDATSLRRLVAAARETEHLRHRLAEGELGVGRARFGLVIAGGLGEWATRFPNNPFGAPSVVALDGEGPDLAVGLARGLAARLVEEVRAVRRAELLLEAPPDLPAKLEELHRVDWKALSPDESSLCPPVLVLLGAEGIGGRERAGIGRLLDARLPLMLVVLDGHDLVGPGATPLTLTLAHRAAFAASTSIAHPDHLFESVSGALSGLRPALIHLHAPSPRRHGFDPARTLERARLAVESRVHPLVRYEPAAEGVFGSRLSLGGNPAVDAAWARSDDDNMLTAADWALGETRFSDAFVSDEGSDGIPVAQWSTLSPGERGARTPTVPGPNGRALAVGGSLSAAVRRHLEHWTTLQELAGVVTPFTAEVREQVEQELRDAQRAEIESLKSRHAVELTELRRSETAAQATRLRERLLQMAGFRKPGADGPGREGSSS
jgi:pyruvate-ferredoxin/flavodoxin oxidoreductase